MIQNLLDKIEGTRIRSSFGGGNKESFLYELQIPDLEQLSSHEKNQIYRSLNRNLCQLEDQEMIKFYKVDNKIFLNSERELSQFNNWNLKEVSDPLRDLFYLKNISTDIHLGKSFFSIGSKKFAILKIIDLPEGISAGFLDDLGVDYMISLIKKSKWKVESKLSSKESESYQLNQGAHRNSSAELAYEDVQELKMSLELGSMRIFNYQSYIMIHGETKEDLFYKVNWLNEELSRSVGIKVRLESHFLDRAIENYMFGSFFSIHSGMETSKYVSNLLPMRKEFLHESGIDLTSIYGQQLFFDPFDSTEVNGHMFISGLSGTGKSSFAIYLALQHHMNFESNLVFIDLGGGLRRSAYYLGGEDYSTYLDPFLFRDDFDFIKKFVISIIGKGTLSKVDEGKIHEVLENHLESSVSFWDLVERLNDVLPEIKYYFNSYREFFYEGGEKVLPKVCYIDTSFIAEDLLDAYLLTIRRILDQMNGKTIVIWDEAWDIISHAPEALKYAVKTDRKKDIANILINQEYNVEDKETQEIVKIIKNNVNFEVIFNQNGMREILNIDSFELFDELVRTEKGQWSRALLTSKSGMRKIIQVEFSPFFYEITMTEKKRLKDQERFLQRQMKYTGFRESFDKWVAFQHEPHVYLEEIRE